MQVNLPRNVVRQATPPHRNLPNRSSATSTDTTEAPRGRHSPATQSRLLDAAEDLFAEKGFEQTSVRDLTTAADCNVASVNYHFGSKDKLYMEMFRRLMTELRQRRIDAVNRIMAQSKPTLEAVLRAFAEAFTEPLADESRGQRLIRLYIRETAAPLLPQGMFYQEIIRPSRQILSEAMDRTCPGLTEREKYQCMHSLVAQLIHIFQARAVLDTGDPSNSSILEYNQMLEHVVRFTAAGIRQMQRQKKGDE